MSQTFDASKFDQIVDGSITSVRSNVTSVGEYAFYGCTNLVSAKFPNATGIGQYAFYGCTSLTDFDFSNINQLSMYGFYGCTSLEKVHVPAGYMKDSLFRGCTALETAVVHTLDGGGSQPDSNVFWGCSNLEVIDVMDIELTSPYSRIGGSMFRECSSLTTLILRPEILMTMRDVNAFTSTPFTTGNTSCTVYIPKSLYDHLNDGTSSDYLANSNWTTINGYGHITWAKIEGSQYEHYYADGTPVE